MNEIAHPEFRLKKVVSWVLLSIYVSTGIIGPVSTAGAAIENNSLSLTPYFVVEGDTLEAIGRRHGISVPALLELNKHAPASLAHGELAVGQTIYVPAAAPALPELGSEHADASREGQDGQVESWLATQAQRIGQTYGQDGALTGAAAQRNRQEQLLGVNTRAGNRAHAASTGEVSVLERETDALVSQAQSAFQSEANARAESLLGELGSARVNINLDNEFRLKTYSADVLAPLSDTPERLLFVQGGVRHNDSSDRTIVNVGVGQRHFLDSWMLGYNAFFDYDLTRGHRRLGLGGEAWADYFKLSANLYTPLSDWKVSPDFDEYLERAARGADINATYYLPQYPQLSINAKAEQYWGDEVDLLGSKKLERDPYAGTLGLAWQPMPLLKMGVDHREAKGGQSDTQLKMGLEWQLGATLDQMLNPANVARSRELQGMRLDLVERNNDIVLEYKEQERTASVTHADIAGMSGDVITLSPAVSLSRGNIVSWRWSSPEPLLQGALSDANVQSPTLTLPALPLDSVADQAFSLSLTVTDERGRTYQSPTIPVVVRVNPAQVQQRLVVVRGGEVAADSMTSPSLAMDIEAAGGEVEFVLVRQSKDDPTNYTTVQASEVQFNQLDGYHVEPLEGEWRSRNVARSSAKTERAWVHKLRITPRDGVMPGIEELRFLAVGEDGTQTDPINLTVQPVAGESAVAPSVSHLRLSGRLEVGQTLTATYRFDSKGGDDRDHSTYAWGNRGETAVRAPTGPAVTTAGEVPGLLLTGADVGQVKELSVQARNGADVTGNTVTLDAAGRATDTSGGTGEGSVDVTGGTDTDGDGNGDTVIDPSRYAAQVRYSSSATVELNGVDGSRPVARRDEMTAYCQVAGEPTFTRCEGRFTLRWLVRDAQGAESVVPDATGSTFTPRPEDQGKAVLVEATPLPSVG